MLRNHHQHRCLYKALTQDILCLLPILRQLKPPLVSHSGLLPLLSPFIIYTCMDELGIYGARKAFCRLYGKAYDECLSSSNPGLQRCPIIRFCRNSCCLLRSSPSDMPLHLREIRSKIHPNQKFNLAVLGVCRHLYEQAHHDSLDYQHLVVRGPGVLWEILLELQSRSVAQIEVPASQQISRGSLPRPYYWLGRSSH